MFTKPILAFILAACGVSSNSPPVEPPDEPITPKDNVYFCCLDVEKKTATGEGCVTIGEKEIDRCDTVLACADGFIKKDGKVTCL